MCLSLFCPEFVAKRVEKLIKKRLTPAWPAGIGFKPGRRNLFSKGLKFSENEMNEKLRAITPEKIRNTGLNGSDTFLAIEYIANEGMRLTPIDHERISQAGIERGTLNITISIIKRNM